MAKKFDFFDVSGMSATHVEYELAEELGLQLNHDGDFLRDVFAHLDEIGDWDLDSYNGRCHRIELHPSPPINGFVYLDFGEREGEKSDGVIDCICRALLVLYRSRVYEEHMT